MLYSMFQIKSSCWVILCSLYPVNNSWSFCYKPLGIQQRLTESQKIHVSSHDGLPNFLTSNMLNIRPRIFQNGDRVARTCLSLIKHYICQVIGLLFSNWSLFTTYTIAGNHRFLRRLL